ncbi:MAG: histidine phosphatase family protein [Ginsengibacter sp.]
MKILLLVRHAKSSWDNLQITDFERSLNDRGKKDAPLMAERVKERKIKIDRFVSSPAKRAKKTAGIFMDEYGVQEKSLVLVPSLYEASVKDFYDAVENLSDKDDSVALFSHNPGITDFVNMLTENKVDNMPTCGVFAVKIKTKNWIDFKKATKEFLFFDYPKNAVD